MPKNSPTLPERASHAGLWFGACVLLAACGEALGFAACWLAGAQPPALAPVLIMAAVAVVLGGLAVALLDWLLLGRFAQLKREVAALRQGAAACGEMELQLATRAEQQSRLRHDLRGALSPALLTADRLINHEDAKVRRAAEIMVKSVDRAAAMLADPDELQPSPPDDP